MGRNNRRRRKSANWAREQNTDRFVRKAREEGYRSRASYKLLELDERYRLFARQKTILDLGAAPGGWSQVAAEFGGSVLAVDLLPMTPIPGVRFIQGDFTSSEIQEAVLNTLGDERCDLVISDMAPNLTGVKAIDQANMSDLLMAAIEFSSRVLRPGGDLLAKAFAGSDLNAIRRELSARFRDTKTCKPQASRSRSSELYLLGRAMTDERVRERGGQFGDHPDV